MLFRNVIPVPRRNLHDHLARLLDHGLASEARVELKIGGQVEAYRLRRLPFRNQVRAFFHPDVAGRAGAVSSASIGLARTFQRLELFGTLTAGENVQVGLESSVKWWQWRHVKRAFPWARRPASTDEPTGPGAIVVETSDRLLEGVGLGGLGAEQASAMSTGLGRMVELARALAMAPKVLLLDEPGSGLDDAESEALGELLTTLARGGMGVLLVEHDMELVMRICDYIYVLDFGDIIAAGTPEEIRKDPMVQAAYLGAVTETEADKAAEAFDLPDDGGSADAGRDATGERDPTDGTTTRWPRHE